MSAAMHAEDPFLDMLLRYRTAVFAKDAEALLALYDDDVEVFDAWDAWSLRGIAAWRETVTDWFSSLGDERVEVGFDTVRTRVDGDLAVGHALLRYTAVSAQGAKLRSLDNRLTAALRLTDRGWKIFHEHTSAPILHDSLQARLHRPSSTESKP